MKVKFLPLAFALIPFLSLAMQTEYLDRGVIAMKTADGVFVSWRSLGNDDKEITFDLYRDGINNR